MLMTERDRVAMEIRTLADKWGHDRVSLVPILQEVKRRRDSAWLEKNRSAIAAYNERVEREELFAAEHRGF